MDPYIQVITYIGVLGLIWLGITGIIGAFRFSYPPLIIYGVGKLMFGLALLTSVYYSTIYLQFATLFLLVAVFCEIIFEFVFKGSRTLDKRGIHIRQLFFFGNIES